MRSASRTTVIGLGLSLGVGVALIAALRHIEGTPTAARHDQSPAPSLARDAPSSEDVDVSVPSSIQPATYQEVAAGTTQTGERFRIFTGRKSRDAAHFADSGCFGLRTPKVVAISCGIDLARTVDLQAMETTFKGHTMVSGLVSPSVAKVLVTNVAGRGAPVPVRNGVFFFDSGRGDAVRAYSADGRVLGTYFLDRSSNP
jgi:hypothetical protein